MDKTIDRCAFLATKAAEIIQTSDDAVADRVWPFIGELANQLQALSRQMDDQSAAITDKWADVFNQTWKSRNATNRG